MINSDDAATTATEENAAAAATATETPAFPGSTGVANATVGKERCPVPGSRVIVPEFRCRRVLVGRRRQGRGSGVEDRRTRVPREASGTACA
jgi:hypothetical protein